MPFDRVAEQDGGGLRVVLRLLDHQVVGPDGEAVGKVDDIVLTQHGSDLVVSGLMSGPAGLAGRQPGRGGAWYAAVWRRLHPAESPRPLVVPIEEVTELDSAVHVTQWAEDVLAANALLELWLRRYVVSRLPGATGGEHRLGGAVARTVVSHPELLMAPDARRLSDLLHSRVVDADGTDRGGVVELVASLPDGGTSRSRPVLSQVVYCRHGMGGTLGYNVDPAQGPWLLKHFMRWWHRKDRVLELTEAARIDWAARRILLRPQSDPPHRDGR